MILEVATLSTRPGEHYALPDAAIGDAALDVLFRRARTHQKWTDRPVSVDQLRAIFALMKWAPTSTNGQPARIVFCQSLEARQRLATCAFEGNRAKVLTAPVTAIIGQDARFYELLPETFPRPNVEALVQKYRGKPELSAEHAFRNSSLQGGYFILAARAVGLDCGPMSGFDNARVDQEFFTTTGFASNFICSIGYGDRSALRPRAPRLAFERACELL